MTTTPTARAAAYVAAFDKAESALLDAHAIGGPAREREADEACRYLVSHFIDRLQPADVFPEPESAAPHATEWPGATTARLHYTNWKGERRMREIAPQYLWYGTTPFHKHPEWLVHAIDVDSGKEKDFALFGFAPEGNGSAAPVSNSGNCEDSRTRGSLTVSDEAVAAAKDWEARAMAAERKLREIEATRDREPMAWVERRDGEPYYSFGDEAIKWFDRHRARAEAAEQKLAAMTAERDIQLHANLHLHGELRDAKENWNLEQDQWESEGAALREKLAASEAALRIATDALQTIHDMADAARGEPT